MDFTAKYAVKIIKPIKFDVKTGTMNEYDVQTIELRQQDRAYLIWVGGEETEKTIYP